MKTSVILVILLLNTTLLFVEPLAKITAGINSWFFASTEVVLLIGYVTHKMVRDLKKAFEIDAIEIFRFKNFNNN
ncbi:hypothetical protein JQC67_04470 [Aurantibacter crassamenti]|uniref:hypothetical protein n=1 Tax=Aurantibacter crassamenti TaxID=1837375 RepID=UPI0019399DFD|nr:hypothetical protein [Aurantibacter crassamenti]MBM1105390.1 hypothetical protein [Aurantibacter crassamenti]